MSGFWTIFRRELGAYFNSAIAAIFLIVFVLFSNGLFLMNFFQIGRADMRPFFGSLPFLLNIFVSSIAMRLWAEDKKGNTFELLMTFPMRPYQLVLGKYVASLAFYAISLGTTFTLPVMINWAGQLDRGVVAAGYLGAFFLGALFLAIGIFISGLCKDQIVSFILTVIATFAVMMSGTDNFAMLVDAWLPGFGTFLKTHVGVASHMVGFGKGVVSLRDVLYFVFAVAVFLFLNGLSLEGRYRPKAKLVFSGAVIVSLISLVLFNGLVRDFASGRFDLTEGQINQTSDVSKKILTGLKVPIQATLYVSSPDSMPTLMKSLEREITDKLEELRVVSDGKLKYRVVHLDPAEQNEESIKKLKNEGVVPFQVESVQKDEVGVKLVYGTLVLEYKEKPQEILPRLVPQALADLEYQLMSRIVKLSLDEKPKVAVYKPKKEEMGPDLVPEEMRDPYKTAKGLMDSNGYEVIDIKLNKEDAIPDGTDALFLLAPGSLGDRQRYEINRYLSGGGTVVVAAQGFEYTYTREPTGMEATPKKLPLDINKLIEKWGIKFNEDILLDESSQVISLMSGQQIGPFAIQMPVKFPNQIVVLEANIDRSSPITKRIPSPFFLYASALDIAENTITSSGLSMSVLFRSSERSWLFPYTGQNLTDLNVQFPTEKPVKGKYPLAMSLEGKFSGPSGEPPAWTESPPSEGASAEAEPAPSSDGASPAAVEAKPGRLVLFGSQQAFNDELLRHPGNLNLFANTVDGLLLGEDLVNIRTSASIIRDLRPLSNGEKLWFRFVTILLVPLALLFGSLARLFIRKKEKEFYLRSREI